MSQPPPDDLTLSLKNVAASPGDVPDSLNLMLQTTRGDIKGIFHPVEGGSGAAIFVGGAMGGLDGPANSLFKRIPDKLRDSAVSSLRLHYRHPDDLEECVLDVLAGCSFLKGIGATDIVLVGHSFGGAVVIKAGQLHEMVRAVVSMSPQLHGTRQVESLGKPLLLIHGATDSVLDSEASEDIFRRALDPKRLVLYGDTGHSLIQASISVERELASWIPARLAAEVMETGRSEEWPEGIDPDTL